MPRGDGTGPQGMGPMTGRALGFCAGFGTPGYANPGVGAGFGRGCGRGRGFRRMSGFTPAPGWVLAGYPVFNSAGASTETEKEYLNRQAEVLENQLEQVKKRLQELNEEQK
ncbi:MAG: DUF5320 domain-containing protein [Firmicutes bacterium]|nr:DUF5320 domain-containing protein [Bacillota bacterium]